MIAAISLMRQARRRDAGGVPPALAGCARAAGLRGFPRLRHYVQDHVIASPAMNAPARDMRIDGFPILWFDNDDDRRRAHRSPEMAACNVDLRLFIGAVSRVICEPRIVVPPARDAARIKLIALLPGEAAMTPHSNATPTGHAACRGWPAWCCIACWSRVPRRTAPSRICR